jgi:hypothetical protein
MKIHYKDLHALENCCKGINGSINILSTQLSTEIKGSLDIEKLIISLANVLDDIENFVIGNDVVVGMDGNGSLIIEGENKDENRNL